MMRATFTVVFFHTRRVMSCVYERERGRVRESERERDVERNAAAIVLSLLSESVLDWHVESVLLLQ